MFIIAKNVKNNIDTNDVNIKNEKKLGNKTKKNIEHIDSAKEDINNSKKDDIDNSLIKNNIEKDSNSNNRSFKKTKKIEVFTAMQKDIIKYYDDLPTSFDNNAVYYLNKSILLPSMLKYNRNLTIHSGIYYKDSTVLIFNNNGENEYLDLNIDIYNDLYSDISISNSPMLKFKDHNEVNKIKETVLDENYNVLAFTYDNSDKQNKEIAFKCKFKDNIYIAITSNNLIKLYKPFFFQDDNIFAAVDNDIIPCLYKKKLLNGDTEIMFIYSEIHKKGACNKVFINDEKKQIPSSFQFYFCIFRLNEQKVIKKINIFYSDCPLTNNSQIV